MDVDVRQIDGEPWEIAEVAGREVSAAIEEVSTALEDFHWAARGSWLSQEEHRTGSMPTGPDFEDAPIGRNLQFVQAQLEKVLKAVKVVTLAASHDPRSH